MIHRTRRRAGVLVPLFSAPSRESWGIGEIADVGPLTAWLAAAGQRVLQLLPISEMAAGQQSPYTATSAMAIDPLYIRMASLEDWLALDGEAALDPADRAQLDHVRQAARIDYAGIRRLKQKALTACFDRFYERHWRRNTVRARRMSTFVEAERWWIEDYALFQTIRQLEDGRPWTDWPEALRRRDAESLQEVGRLHERTIIFFQYLQWLASLQWRSARRVAKANGVALFGDLPFMVDGDSADVWRYQHAFRLDVSIGAPPDAFSDTGQDWGMPLYDWAAFQHEDFRWLRERARRNAELYDGYRVDHLVGFYRTYGRPRAGGAPFFTPAVEADQQWLGENLMRIFKASGAEIIAEDLGLVPDFVRASLAAEGIPGFRVFRWERLWLEPDQPFRDPADYPVESVAASGTHDTEALAVWWSQADEAEKRQVNALPTIQRLTGGAGIDDRGEGLLEAIFAAASQLVLAPVTDVFGWRDRINEPGTVTDDNWTFRLPWPVDQLNDVPEARARQAQLRAWSERHHRV